MYSAQFEDLLSCEEISTAKNSAVLIVSEDADKYLELVTKTAAHETQCSLLQPTCLDDELRKTVCSSVTP